MQVEPRESRVEKRAEGRLGWRYADAASRCLAGECDSGIWVGELREGIGYAVVGLMAGYSAWYTGRFA